MLLDKKLVDKYEKTKQHTSLRGIQRELVELTGMKQSNMSNALKGEWEINKRNYAIIENYLNEVKIPRQRKL
jgi:DNA-binding transcriptional regulator YdaS (Cro superfamily)